MTSHEHDHDIKKDGGKHTGKDGENAAAADRLSNGLVAASEDGAFYITKEDGDVEPFDPRKLEESLVSWKT